MTFTSAGTPSGPLVPVSNIGCDAVSFPSTIPHDFYVLNCIQADYPAELAGKIALISRGTCTFAIKATLSKAAGAIGTIIYNNVEGLLQGTLGGAGDYAPTVGISQADGQTLLALVASSTATADLIVELSEILTYVVPSPLYQIC